MRRILRSLFRCVLIGLLWLGWMSSAQAGELSDRLNSYPNWNSKPPTQTAQGDLIYPTWFKGDWSVETTLLDLAAPLAPEVTTPGFESNRSLLEKPITFPVRFIEEPAKSRFPALKKENLPGIISDRAFNGLSLSRAYLGDRAVFSVKVDPTNPNRQVTLLRGDRQLASTVTARATEAPTPEEFLTTEVFQQEFRGSSQLYFNEVETTTRYQLQPNDSPAIVADQVTAIYLSPQDPNFFKAGDRPVALYRYRLKFFSITR